MQLWPRLLSRPGHQEAVRLLRNNHEPYYHLTMLNARKLLDTWELLGRRPLEWSFARQLLTLPKEESLEDWFARCRNMRRPRRGRAVDRAAARVRGGCRGFRRVGRAKRAPPTFDDTPDGGARFARPTLRISPAPVPYLRPDGAAVVRDGLLENDPAAGYGAICQQGQRRLRPRPAHAGAAQPSTPRPGGPGRLPAGLLPADHRDRGHDRPRADRRVALPLADRFQLFLVGRLAEEPATGNSRAGSDHGDSRPQSPPGSRYVRPLRHGLHGRRLRLSAYGAGDRGWPQPAPTTTTRPPPR